jgi:NAD(P)H-hydrate epimerase
MVRITGRDKSDIEKHRVEVLRDSVRRLNASIVLKGAHSLTGFPDGSVYINVSGATSGNSGMATAGSGDVLNGTIAAMYCLGLDFREAVRTGVFIHGLAGDFAAQKKGPDGMTAKDILDNLPNAVLHYRENLGEIAENLYNTIFEV